ncbi:hypothetical protein C7374_1149 [Falsochrobactrum ovis]|uniref:Uncharacterized protein n=1 Tax=Falsochrobactrum ovis TaxID=1293442 RepID=A0A364JSN9_9HYPH|nr:hypothetical protein C7374_1149 [Falsochrobactrum ovis]
MKLTFNTGIAAYLIIAMLTFGYAASSTECSNKVLEPRDCQAFRGFVSGAAWPLYWTWEGFVLGRQARKGSEG